MPVIKVPFISSGLQNVPALESREAGMEQDL